MEMKTTASTTAASERAGKEGSSKKQQKMIRKGGKTKQNEANSVTIKGKNGCFLPRRTSGSKGANRCSRWTFAGRRHLRPIRPNGFRDRSGNPIGRCLVSRRNCWPCPVNKPTNWVREGKEKRNGTRIRWNSYLYRKKREKEKGNGPG